ncbi:MAG TPA: PHB depolymerase family esterase [Fimbriimonadaceae bacterium]|nr:PHB depolymerase family esterase [Fimbriimonadaceae bacterium]
MGFPAGAVVFAEVTRILALLATLNLAACRPPVPEASSPVVGPGRYDRTMSVDGVQRKYLLVVPEGYSAGRSAPLIVLLHGYSSNGPQIAAYSRLAKLADRDGFILAAPTGMGRVNGWNCGFANLGARGVDDIKFVGELMTKLEAELAVDPKRIYVAGHSNGAMLSYAVGAAYSDRVAALGIVAGSNGVDLPHFKRTVPAPKQPVSAIIFHGTNDRLLPYNAGSNSKCLYLNPLGSAILWARGDGITADSKQTTLGDSGSAIQWSGNSADVELVTVNGGNHMWPGAPGSTGKGIDATELMLDFFKTHPKR